MIHIPYFTKRAAAKRQAKIDELLNSPTLMLRDSIIVNPLYKGPHPYRGPEMSDPANKGKTFIFIREPIPQDFSRTKPYRKGRKSRELRFEEVEEMICAGYLLHAI
ncbi:hypothetical protein H2248_005731 [Termitomyces sp. 'cryptogamus']|nr:hypothetical protein H2248_005731 [Termitomyces sp. 'cryptogamus']